MPNNICKNKMLEAGETMVPETCPMCKFGPCQMGMLTSRPEGVQDALTKPELPPLSAFQKESIYTLTKGSLKIEFPSAVSSDEIEEIQQFFDLCMKQARRCAVSDEELSRYRS